MKQYDVFLEGPHVFREKRRLRFSELQRSFDDIKDTFDVCSDFEKRFAIETASISIVEYDEFGDNRRTIYEFANLGKDEGCGSKIGRLHVDQSSCAAPLLVRTAKMSGCAWSELELEKDFEPENLTVLLKEVVMDDGSCQDCVVGLAYKGNRISLEEEAVPVEFAYHVEWCHNKKDVKLLSDIPSALRTIGFPLPDHKECVYLPDGRGCDREVYVIGFECAPPNDGSAICIKPNEMADNDGLYRCCQVTENILMLSALSKHDKIGWPVRPDEKRYFTLSDSNKKYDVCKDVVIDGNGKEVAIQLRRFYESESNPTEAELKGIVEEEVLEADEAVALARKAFTDAGINPDENEDS